MSRDFPMVELGKVLSLAIDAVSVDPAKSYPMAGVYGFGRGLFAREPLAGTNTTYKFLHRLHTNDFVVSQPKGWEGALTRVTASFDGRFLSPVFPTFRANPDRLDIAYLDWYCKQSKVWEELRHKARGIGARRESILPAQFLSLEIPLPSLAEQRSIVARIEELAAKIEEARGLRRESEESIKALLLSAYSDVVKDAPYLPMSEVAPLVRRPIQVNIAETYRELGIRSFGKGTFHKPAISGAELGSKRIFAIEPNDLLFNIVFAWEAAVAVAQPHDAGRVGSHRFLSCIAKEGVTTPKFLCFHFLTRQGLEQLGEASPGGVDRNRTLGLQALANLRVPIPTFEKQLWFDSIHSKFDSIKRLQDEAAAELDALLPSILDKAFKGEL